MNARDDIFLEPSEDSSERRRPHSALARARTLFGLRQTDLAKAVGLSAAWISGVEHGTIVPSLQQKIEIAKFLKVPVESVFPDDSDEGME